MDMKKWIVVTGASSGIGLQTARQLLENGYCVVATARNAQLLDQKFTTYSDTCIILPWDLSDPDRIKEYASLVHEKAGAVYGLIHCAGAQKTLPIHMLKSSNLTELFQINTFSGLLLVSAFAKKGYYMEGEASFLLISSLSAHEGAYGKTAYAASKAALEGFVKSAAPELAEKGIRINAVAPGVVRTTMVEKHFQQLTETQRNSTIGEYPLGLGESQDISNLLEFLISDKSRWITGQTILIDGGHTVRKC
ncbi:MAG: short-chain dehydrogenase [Bacillota bacterium]|jgi:NAD(P)-dependent dehydrogenase (short-subunit alcohol dehydrogenase family)|nr:short-chain dehydrogenase [Bacillota bacterium]